MEHINISSGDVILVSKPRKGLYNQTVCQLIRFFTEFEYHHAAIACFRPDKQEIWIYEAVFNGFKPTYSLKDYLKRAKEKSIKLKILPFENSQPVSRKDMQNRVYELCGSPYDYASLLFYQLIDKTCLKLFNKNCWLGKCGPKAKGKTYCTEAVAYIRGYENWWNYTAKDLYDAYCKQLK